MHGVRQTFVNRFFGYTLVIFLLVCVHLPCFYFKFNFYCLVHTFDSMVSGDTIESKYGNKNSAKTRFVRISIHQTMVIL